MDATCMYMCFLPASQTNTHALARINTYVSSRVLAWPQGPKPNAPMVQYTSTVHMLTPLKHTHTHTHTHTCTYAHTRSQTPTNTQTDYFGIHKGTDTKKHTHTHTQTILAPPLYPLYTDWKCNTCWRILL